MVTCHFYLMCWNDVVFCSHWKIWNRLLCATLFGMVKLLFLWNVLLETPFFFVISWLSEAFVKLSYKEVPNSSETTQTSFPIKMLNESAMTNSVSSNIWIQSRQKKTKKQQKHTNKELCTQGSSKPENVRQQKREARSAYFTKNSKNKKKKLKCSFLSFSLPYWSIVGDVVKSKRPLTWMHCMWLLPLDCNQQSCSLFCSHLSPALLFFGE